MNTVSSQSTLTDTETGLKVDVRVKIKTVGKSASKEEKKPPSRFWLKLANLLGALGYLGVFVQIMWVVLTIGLPHLQRSHWADTLFPPVEQVQVEEKPEENNNGYRYNPTGSRAVAAFVGMMIIIVLMVVFGVYYTLRGVGKKSGDVVHKVAEAAAVKVVHRKHVEPKAEAKEVQKWTFNVTWWLKLAMVILPIPFLLIPLAKDFELTAQMVQIGGIFLGGVTLFWFGLQFLLVKIARLNPTQVW